MMMDKIEELKRNAYKRMQNANGTEWVEYHFDEEDLEQYTQQVNKKKEKIAFIAGMGYVKPGLKSENYKEDAFDEWYFNQQNQQ